MLAYIRSRVASSEDAEDILQEAFVAAVRAPNVWRETDRLIRWMYRVIRNRIVERYRSQDRWRLLVSRLGSDESLEEVLVDLGADIGAQVEHEIIEEYLACCIRRLPAAQREVFVLSELEGRCFSDIELRVPGVPRQTLVWRRHAAIKKMRRWMSEMLE